MLNPDASLVFALALASAVTAQSLARHLRMPSIVLLLALGVGLGPDGLGLIRSEALGSGLFELVSLSVAVILFEGGLNLELRRLRRAASTIRRLVTFGALVTATGGTLAARFAMEWPWERALLFGTLVIVSGPTVIKPLMRIVPLRARLATVLEAEGVLIDPIGAIVAAVTLQVVLGPSADSFASGLHDLALGLAFGTLAGGLFGLLLGLLLRPRGLIPDGLENLVTLGLVLLLFELCEKFVPESGILAVTVAGVVLGNAGAHVDRKLGEFEEYLTIGLVGILFVLLAASVRVEEVFALGSAGLWTVAALVFVVRPLNVLLTTLGSDLDARERIFLSWIAPRGIVAAAVASLFAAWMAERGVAGGSELRALVFLTIGVTVVLQAGSAPFVARLLGVRIPGRDVVAILGAEELGLALGEVLREGDAPVLFLDANPRNCREAEQRGFPVVYGNALDEWVLARARLERARAVVGLTPNDEVNSLFAREAREQFGVPDSYVATGRAGSGVTDRVLERQQSRMLFGGATDVERWSVRFRHGAARVEHFRWQQPPAPEEKETDTEPRARSGDAGSGEQDSHILLAVRRSGEWAPMHTRFAPKEGDVAAVAFHVPEKAEVEAELALRGWRRVAPDSQQEE